MSVERGPARWGAVAVIPGSVVAGGQLVKLHPNCRIATLISRDEIATSAEGMYGSLRHLVKPILEKISVATRTWTASLKPTNSSLVLTSLKTWYPRSLLLTEARLLLVDRQLQLGHHRPHPAHGLFGRAAAADDEVVRIVDDSCIETLLVPARLPPLHKAPHVHIGEQR